MKQRLLLWACRFLAEVPHAFAPRVQKLLPFLMTAYCGEGVPFLLPALLQVLDWDSPDAEGRADWVAALLQKQVCSWPSLCSSAPSGESFSDEPVMQNIAFSKLSQVYAAL